MHLCHTLDVSKDPARANGLTLRLGCQDVHEDHVSAQVWNWACASLKNSSRHTGAMAKQSQYVYRLTGVAFRAVLLHSWSAPGSVATIRPTFSLLSLSALKLKFDFDLKLLNSLRTPKNNDHFDRLKGNHHFDRLIGTSPICLHCFYSYNSYNFVHRIEQSKTRTTLTQGCI